MGRLFECDFSVVEGAAAWMTTEKRWRRGEVMLAHLGPDPDFILRHKKQYCISNPMRHEPFAGQRES